MREDGFYWIKHSPDAQWKVAEWNGEVWFVTFDDNFYYDNEFHEICEERLVK